MQMSILSFIRASVTCLSLAVLPSSCISKQVVIKQSVSKQTDNLLLNTKQLFLKSEQQCLATAIYMEARGESIKGKIAVANVIMNRVKSKDFRNSVCSVVFRKGQFSWTNKLDKKLYKQKSSARPLEGSTSVFKPMELPSYRQASEIASKAILGALPKVLPPGTMWFTTKDIKPSWTKNMIKVATIGNHVFYKKK